MILYLFGGSSKATEAKHNALLNQELEVIQPVQLLYLDFARTDEARREEKLREMKRVVGQLNHCQLLNARLDEDIKLARDPTLFVGGGESNAQLLAAIKSRPTLLSLIKRCQFYFGSSAGAMIVGEKVREQDDQPLLNGLNILSGTIIEPHYTQWKRKEALRWEMRNGNCRFGIGIDEACALVVDPAEFPKKYRTLGEGLVEVAKTGQFKL